MHRDYKPGLTRRLPRMCFIVAALALVLSGCGKEASILPEGARGPALWAVSAPDGTVQGWLFGTIHAMPDNVQWQSEVMDAALREADVLVVEVTDLNDPEAAQAIFAASAFDRDEGPILNRVEDAKRPELAALIARHNLDPATLDTMESWAAALTLAQLAQQGRGENGADRALLARFKGGEVIELEGAKIQLGLFDALPVREQRDLLGAVIDENAQFAKDSATMVEHWRRGDLEGLSAMTRRGILADPELRRALLADRNAAWSAKIENLLTANVRPFIAVGAGHMLGSEGLPALLSRHGYTVRRIQ